LGRRTAIRHIASFPVSKRLSSLFFLFLGNKNGPYGLPMLIVTFGLTPLNSCFQTFSNPKIPIGSILDSVSAERYAAPFFAGLNVEDVDVPSGKIPKISLPFSALVACFIVDGASVFRFVGINPYINGAHIKYHFILWSLAARKLIGFRTACITNTGST